MQLFDFHHHHSQVENGIYNVKLFETTPKHLFSVGIHPQDILTKPKEAMDWLETISQNPRCLAIGECGLDALINISEKEQNIAFTQQIIWANEIKKPIIVHCVRRFSEMLKYKKIAKVPMIIHGFNKKKSIADTMQDAGFYLSFGKSLLDNLSLQTVFKEFPIEKIFLETDDKNFDINELYHLASLIKNISIENLVQQIENNLIEIQKND